MNDLLFQHHILLLLIELLRHGNGPFLLHKLILQLLSSRSHGLGPRWWLAVFGRILSGFSVGTAPGDSFTFASLFLLQDLGIQVGTLVRARINLFGVSVLALSLVHFLFQPTGLFIHFSQCCELLQLEEEFCRFLLLGSQVVPSAHEGVQLRFLVKIEFQLEEELVLARNLRWPPS